MGFAICSCSWGYAFNASLDIPLRVSGQFDNRRGCISPHQSIATHQQNHNKGIVSTSPCTALVEYRVIGTEQHNKTENTSVSQNHC